MDLNELVFHFFVHHVLGNFEDRHGEKRVLDHPESTKSI